MEKRTMKTATRKTRPFGSYADVPKTYRELCQLYLPRPIHAASEDEAATEMMNALAVFPKLNPEQQDYLDALTEFVDACDKAKPVRWPKIKGLGRAQALDDRTRNERRAPLAHPGRQPQSGCDDSARGPQSHPGACSQAGNPFQCQPGVVYLIT